MSYVALRIYAVVVALVGLALLVGGFKLVTLGGSFYYVLCGAAVVASGVLLFLRRATGALLYGAMFLVTVAWALWESGFFGWALMPRIVSPAVLGLVLLIPAIRRSLEGWPTYPRATPLLGLIVAIVLGGVLHSVLPPNIPADPMFQNGMATAQKAAAMPDSVMKSEWLHFGGDAAATRFSALEQITPENVSKLKVAWTYDAGPNARYEVTPLKVNDTLYICTGVNRVVAVGAETGKERWAFDPKVTIKSPTNTCRGVAYYRAAEASDKCAERILMNSVDARLFALDAKTGERCADFGTDGEVSLLTGMGEVISGYYYPTSAPTLIRGKVVIGGWVADNQKLGEPSGVIRAFDAVTGKLAWAWDLGNPDRTGEPPAGEEYTRGTPNAWAPMSADEELGLVYVPLGNATPDYYAATRRPFDHEYGDSIVALDADTGRDRWHFQTTHHDIWDYDIPSAPSLVDYPSANGVVKALVQPTKRGELFVLDRATGAPLKEVKEVPVPQKGGAPEEKLSPTQPFSTGMPSFRGGHLVESQMWGITALDQLWCRIRFNELRYEGPLTPNGPTEGLSYPGNVGGMKWGGVSIDPRRSVVISNSQSFPVVTQLVARKEADAMGIKPMIAENAGNVPLGYADAQAETPYAHTTTPFFSPLSVPCTQPPFGRLSATDLVSGKLIWSVPFGTADQLGPMGYKSHLPFPIGTVTFGGSMTTSSGLVFIGATMDNRFRAFDTTTGKELWSAMMPQSSTATPISYQTTGGKQFIVIATTGAGGDPHGATGKTEGAYLIAYTLP